MSTTINSALTEEMSSAMKSVAAATTTTTTATCADTPLEPFWPTVQCANASTNALVSAQPREQQLQPLQLAKNAPLLSSSMTMPTTITNLLTGTSLLPFSLSSSATTTAPALSLSPSTAKEFLEDCQSNLTLIKSQQQQDKMQQQQQQDESNNLLITADADTSPLLISSTNNSTATLNIAASSLIKSSSAASLLKTEYCLDSCHDSCNMVQLSKKPCTLDFYTSTGSQSKWYLPPASPAEEAINSATLTIPSQMSMSSSAAFMSTDLNSEQCLMPPTALMMTKSMVSLAMPESSIVTPPSPAEEMLPNQAFLSVQQQQQQPAVDLAANDNKM